MMKLRKTFFKLSFLLPSNLVNSFSKLMVQGGFTLPAREYLGYSVVLSFLLAIVAFQAASFFVEYQYSLIAAVIMFGVFLFLFYLVVMTTADNRARKIEEVLPDALQMMSANIRAGMTMENAIWASAKPEFGPLEEEIRIVSGKAFGGKSVTDALREMGERIRSRRLGRAISLLCEGIQLGGEVAPLLDGVARDLRTSNMLAKEIASATTMYTIFIIFTSVIASPVMFASSVYYADISSFISAQRGIELPPGAGTSLGGGLTGMIATGGAKAEAISPQDVMQFSVACIILTTFFGALILAEIRHGKLTRGLKYIPIFVLIALAVFFTAYGFLKNAFGFLMT